MPTPRHTAATGVAEGRGPTSEFGGPLPDALEARLREVESNAPSTDFDANSWLWMILLGALLPIGLIAYGWWATGAAR